MPPLELAGALLVLCTTVGAGLVAHELTHALVLYGFGIPHDINWFPRQSGSSRFGVDRSAPVATVTPRSIPTGVPRWGLQLSAIAPLVLALPFVLVPIGFLPDPLATNNPFVIGMTVGWLACALPSPQDFDLFWHTEAAISGTSPGRSYPETQD